MKFGKHLFYLTLLLMSVTAYAKRDFYEIRIYHIKGNTQEQVVDKYLKEAFIPGLHRAGVGKVGVFKPVETDTAAGKRIYVFVPYTSLDQYSKLPDVLAKDKTYATAGKDYLDAPYDNPPYTRMETILLQAFTGMQQYAVPTHATPAADRVYELRSYEGHTEKIWRNKVKMFNDGDEVGLFKRLGFNAVFYAEVIAGSHMPNLMYMTSFANMAAREEHWKTFRDDAQWKTLSAMPEYQHNVSHIDIFLLHPTAYSEI